MLDVLTNILFALGIIGISITQIFQARIIRTQAGRLMDLRVRLQQLAVRAARLESRLDDDDG